MAHVIKKFERTGEEKEDLISIGTIGLIKAVNTFNLRRGTRLATYAARCIENEILMFLRAASRRKQEISLQEPIGIDKEGNEITLMEVISSEDTIFEEVELNLLREKLGKMIGNLKSREQKVLTMRFGHEEGGAPYPEADRRHAGHLPLLRLPHRKTRPAETRIRI